MHDEARHSDHTMLKIAQLFCLLTIFFFVLGLLLIPIFLLFPSTSLSHLTVIVVTVLAHLLSYLITKRFSKKWQDYCASWSPEKALLFSRLLGLPGMLVIGYMLFGDLSPIFAYLR